MFNISEELKKLPEKSGVYIMKDKDENIIYIGKSVNLKNRVRQYFQESSKENLKTKMLSSQINSFEYIITTNEIEALVLENNLIKTNKPKYNIALKDDKTYPYIKITNEMFPCIIKVRIVKKDGAVYFGPYSDFVANETINIIHNIWQIRSSKKKLPRDLNKSRACLNYHIGRCKAPCISLVSEYEYSIIIKEVINFLNSNYDELIKKLTDDMLNAADNLNFEYAKVIRNKIEAINNLKQKQNLENVSSNNQDVIALAKNENDALIQIFFIRGGKMTGRESIFLEGNMELLNSEIITSFIKQFYSEISFIPEEILLGEKIEDKEIITNWLKSISNHNVKILNPKKGNKNKLVELAENNAQITLNQFGKELKRQKDKTIGAVEDIRLALGISDIKRIEAYDISNIQGFESVGSMVVFENGRPKHSDYRKFKIKTVKGSDDYASISEILDRRFKRYLKSKEENTENFSKLPDIIFVDGAAGQINAVKKVLNTLCINIPIAGMVKDENHKTKCLLYNEKEIFFPKNSDTFKLITRIQDEVHRFAIEYHRKLRKDTLIKSELDDIEGIGKKRKNALFSKFGSIEKIKSATLKELEETKGFNSKVAQKLYDFFNS
ncbi:MAG: excinuclease ABC subunit UvrC [Defluviitaleaceae bacterium]|nr:excinuclease ABC subunit UvrC [Defluviitaleaceae bacterium]